MSNDYETNAIFFTGWNEVFAESRKREQQMGERGPFDVKVQGDTTTYRVWPSGQVLGIAA